MHLVKRPDGKTFALFDLLGMKYELSGHLVSNQAGFTVFYNEPASSYTEEFIPILRENDGYLSAEVLVTRLCDRIKINYRFVPRKHGFPITALDHSVPNTVGLLQQHRSKKKRKKSQKS